MKLKSNIFKKALLEGPPQLGLWSTLASNIVADILSMTLVKPPGEMGADIACGSGQRLGIPLGYGGPHPGYFAVQDKLKRKSPGRIIGISKDVNGDQAFRMAL